MALTERQLATIRDWVGDEIPESELEARWARDGDLGLVIVGALRHRRAQMTLDEPGVIVVDGMTINQSTNMQELDDLIDKFLRGGGLATGGRIRTTQLVREQGR